MDDLPQSNVEGGSFSEVDILQTPEKDWNITVLEQYRQQHPAIRRGIAPS
jgi:hypothetical protein